MVVVPYDFEHTCVVAVGMLCWSSELVVVSQWAMVNVFLQGRPSRCRELTVGSVDEDDIVDADIILTIQHQHQDEQN